MERRDLVAMIAIVAVGCVATIALGERIGVHNGQGWDGRSYVSWARDFPALIEHGVTSFQSDRVLPSATVYCTLGALGIERTLANVIHAFQVLNTLALVVTAVLLYRIAGLLAWSRSAGWVAFVATFLGFANARHALYYPTMTDPAGFLLGMATVWAYLARRPIAQAVIVFASAFTWPALVPLGLLALVFPRPIELPPITTGRWHRPLAIALGVAALLFITSWFVWVLLNPAGAEPWMDRSHRQLWPLAIACVAIPSAVAAYVVARNDQTWSVGAYVRRIGVARIAAGIAAAVVILGIRELWRANVGVKGEGFGWRELRLYYVASAVRGPLWNVVHQVVYYGPIVVLAIGAWPRIAGTAARWGPTAVLGTGLLVVSAVSADARHLLHAMPFAIVVTVTATAEWWTPRRAIVFAVLGLAWSKLWWPIGYDTIHNSYDWPDLRWFMHHGPWASDATFLAHGAAAVVTAIALWLVLRRRDRDQLVAGSPDH